MGKKISFTHFREHVLHWVNKVNTPKFEFHGSIVSRYLSASRIFKLLRLSRTLAG